MLESPDTSAQHNDDNAPSGGRTWTLVASALFIIAIVLGAVLVYALPDEKTPDAATPSTPSAGPTGPAASGGSGDVRDKFGTPKVDALGRPVQVPINPSGQVLPQSGGPAFTASDPAWLTGAPKGLMWQSIYNGASVPFSTSDGPTSLTDGVPTGFTRTPQGAVMAAWQITWRISFEPDHARRVALIKRATVSDGSAAGDRGQQSAINDIDGATADPYVQGMNVGGNIPIAVKVKEFTPDYALVSFGLTTAPRPTVGGVEGVRNEMQVVWRDGEWKVPFPLLNSVVPQPSFVGWSRQW